MTRAAVVSGAPDPSPRWWRAAGDRPLLFATLLRTLRSRTRGRLLDVGCGRGQFLRRSARHYETYGVDVSEQRVSIARSVSPDSDVRVASAEELPFSDGFFDVVTALDVVEHLETPERFFQETSRVLSAGGVVLFSTPNPGSFGHRRKGEESFIYDDPTHVSVRPPASWRQTTAAAGLAIVKDGTDFLWDPPYFRRAKRLQRFAFLGIAQAVFAVGFAFPWSQGENYWCLAEKSPA